MTEFFVTIVNMSISAGWIVLAVLLLRLLLKKTPKWIIVLLWGIVAVRLICPVSIESAWSLIPSAQTINPEVALNPPIISSGVAVIDDIVNPVIGGATISFQPEKELNFYKFIMPYLAAVWFIGIVVSFIYTAFSYMQLKKKIGTAVLFKDNIFQNENVSSPFVLGIIRPKIYIPFNMNDQDLEHVVAHEEAHIQRKDHWWKPLGFFLLTIHWFNPLMWLAYVLLCRDIEFACDEKVIKELGNEQRADYTQALVACSIRRRSIAACPLAFGEVGVKERVKSVMKYKKPTIIVVLLALLTCVIVAVCFLTNPRRDSFDIRIVVPAGSQESFVYSDEEISPLRDYVIISAETLTPHQPMVLKPVEIKQENIYEPIYAIHGFPVKTTAEKGAWFKIGINVQNPTDQDLVVYVNVKYVEVRISDGDRTSLEENGSGTYPTYEYLEESDENTPQETMTHVIYVMDNTIQEINRGDLRQLVEMTKEDAQSLRQLVDGVEWTEGTSDCLSDWALNLGGHLIYYHSECGTFNEPNLYTMSTISSKEPENVGRCYSLTEEEQDLVESLLKKYISLGSRDE